MPSADLIIFGRRIVLPGGVRPGCIIVKNGVIRSITEAPDVSHHAGLFDAGDSVVMPGVIDTHVHINDPGRAGWEGFETATRAAAAGGITTLVDMPLNSIPATTDPPSLEAKRRAAEGRCHVDVAAWGGVVPGNADQIEPLRRAGVLGFKCFMAPSGVDEFGHVGEAELREAAPILARIGAPLLVHAEDPAVLATAPRIPHGRERRYSGYLATRPPEAEQRAIEVIIRLVEEYGFRAHIVHVACPEAVSGGGILRAGRASGLPITAETCPHYLTFAAEAIADGATQFKCAPPIRGAAAREALWGALRDGVIDLVASDHSPSPPGIKCLDSGDFGRAWGGIASLQVSLAATWTGAAARGFPVTDLARWMCEQPARLAGLNKRKGLIAPGYDADFAIWDPDASFTVDARTLHHRHAITPYDGLTLRGVVERTIVRGVEVFSRGHFSTVPAGRWINA